MSVYDDYNNPDLFKDNPPGEYTYVDTPYGKMAYGQLTLSEDPQRDAKAQREAGGEDRRSGNDSWGKDDGGHLIGARFGGAPDAKNLVPQNSNFNRSTYKSLENSWAEHLEAGDKVYVVVDCYTGTDSQRPSAYTVTTIVEHTDEQGRTTRDIDVFSTINESDKTKEAIDEEQRAFEEAHPEYVEEQR
ncbi:MAG: DNA/RNA non-specific endonuclease, partial [Oscillospiraceae bacterium]|nr:DNA/RNA non-specific endonuclease [Oscillospiraceae bacterium]